MKLVISALLVFIFNVPFGYWRANVKKFSLQWVLAIHIPVPFIIGLRIYSDLGFAWHTYVFLVAAFFLGQKAGYQLHKRIKTISGKADSFLFHDILLLLKKQHTD